MNGGDQMYRILKSKNLIVAFAFLAAMALSTAPVHAQLVGELEANIPFSFSADNTRLPAGVYYIHPTEGMGLTVLEIENEKKDTAVFILPEESQHTQAPKISELTFDKIGNHYFLRGITIENSLLGYDLAQSKAEVKLAKNNARIEKHRLTIKHHKTMRGKS
jgi:hypothetical protein